MKPSFSSVFVAAYALTIGLTLGFYAPNAEACSPPSGRLQHRSRNRKPTPHQRRRRFYRTSDDA